VSLPAGVGVVRLSAGLVYSGGREGLLIPVALRSTVLEVELRERTSRRLVELDWVPAGPVVKLPLGLASVDAGSLELLEPNARLRWSLVANHELPVGDYELRCSVRPDVLLAAQRDAWSPRIEPGEPVRAAVALPQTSGQRAEVHVLRGRQARAEGRVQDALRDFEAAIAEDPDGVQPRLQLAYALEAVGQLDRAELAYQAAFDRFQTKAAGPQSERYHPENRAGSLARDGLVRVALKRGQDARALDLLLGSLNRADAEARLASIRASIAKAEGLAESTE
jgi:tetratricopeptide (TPR) repeat protein